jgi:hypothetical protein
MNMVSVVILASPPRYLIRSKRHNGWRLQAMHTYSATTPPPPRSSKAWGRGRWDQQHDGVMLMVKSICGQGFAYAHEVEEEIDKRRLQKPSSGSAKFRSTEPRLVYPFIGRGCLGIDAHGVDCKMVEPPVWSNNRRHARSHQDAR